jgi:predicted AAA+ superfamily ATPase
LASLALNAGTSAPLTRIAADASGGVAAVTDDTVADYIQALERVMVIEQVPPWNTHLRSKRRLRTTPVRQFVDPGRWRSLRCARVRRRCGPT